MYNLFNLEKKGTLVLASYRYGAHYLANKISDLLPLSVRPGANHRGLDFGLFHLTLGDTFFRWTKFNNNPQPNYQIVVANHFSAKLLMLSNPELFDDWHIVRIVHNDKIRWFRSYWYHLVLAQPEFKHHGTNTASYQQDLNLHKKYNIDTTQFVSIMSALGQGLINQDISCDEHVFYEDLPLIQSNLPSGPDSHWQPNQYPDVPLREMFEDGTYIENLMSNWPKEVLSKIR